MFPRRTKYNAASFLPLFLTRFDFQEAPTFMTSFNTEAYDRTDRCFAPEIVTNDYFKVALIGFWVTWEQRTPGQAKKKQTPLTHPADAGGMFIAT